MEMKYDSMEKKNIIINVGRQFGSGGKSIALALGEKLGIPVYDQELVKKAAVESGISASFFSKGDEKRRFWRLGSFFSSLHAGSGTSGLDDASLFNIQSRVIRKIASEGSAIFVGRASDYILRDMKCLNVFITAPLEVRRERVSKRENISPEDAASMIEKRDKGRAEFYNFFTFSHWGKASTYNLCVDSSLLGIEGTAEYIIDFGKKAGLI